MSEDFANAPQTIGEIRSNKTANGADWTPRETLIALLRSIDKGEIKPNALIAVWGEIGADGRGRIDFNVSAPNICVTLGLLSRAAYRVNINCDPD